MVFPYSLQGTVRIGRPVLRGRYGVARAVVVLMLVAPAMQAADWPEWGGNASRNMASGETALPAGLESAQKLWKARLGSQTYGTPAVAGGKVVVGTNDSSLKDDILCCPRGDSIDSLPLLR